jgi:site-specific DNA-methyltransferase (adenine-specific)
LAGVSLVNQELADVGQLPFRSNIGQLENGAFLAANRLYCGDSRSLLRRVEPETIALSFWSPPYFVGKSYEKHLSFEEWQDLLREVVHLHFNIIAPGGFLGINIADILAFPDPDMPRIQADNVSSKRSGITREQVLSAKSEHPDFNRYQLAEFLGCSEQTIDRRLNHNNVRGGKYASQTKVKLIGGLVQGWAEDAGFYLYDRRAWVKDPCWENSRWHSLSYRAVDEFEYIYIFWKPGISVIDRTRLSKEEWSEWGSRAVWEIPSVRNNSEHEAQFPLELPRRVIRIFSGKGDLVIDPFMGLGTTAVAAIREERRYIGIDYIPEYVEKAAARIALESAR